MKRLLIPTSERLEQIISNDSYISKYNDRVYFFISYLFNKHNYDDRYKLKSYIDIYSNRFRELLTKNYYDKMIKFLKSNNIIECNNSYRNAENKADSFCLGYRLNQEYMNTIGKHYFLKEKRMIEKTKNYILRSKINDKTAKNLKQVYFDYNDVYSVLSRIDNQLIDLSLQSTKISEEMFINYLNNIHKNILLTDVENIHKLNNYLFNIEQIIYKDFRVLRDYTENRLHTNITTLPKLLRNCLRVDGKKLVNVDIRNSQPFLLNKLLPEVSLFGDIEAYKQLSSSGQLYNHLSKLCKGGDAENEDVRMTFKKDFYRNILFGKKFYKNDLSDIFKKEFPSVVDFIIEYKKEDYKKLSINLAKFESSIVIDKIYANLLNENIFSLTIHDSILCFEEDVDKVCEKFNKEFNKLKLYPTLNTK